MIRNIYILRSRSLKKLHGEDPGVFKETPAEAGVKGLKRANATKVLCVPVSPDAPWGGWRQLAMPVSKNFQANYYTKVIQCQVYILITEIKSAGQAEGPALAPGVEKLTRRLTATPDMPAQLGVGRLCAFGANNALPLCRAIRLVRPG